jgi:hypothetical protein
MSTAKLSAAYPQTTSQAKTFPLELWRRANEHSSLNGFYIAGQNYVNGIWSDLSGSTNYLRQESVSLRPVSIPDDSQFNFNTSLDFSDTGNTYLRFAMPVYIGTILLVYNLRQVNTGHPIYAPRVISNTAPPVYYDLFPRAGSDMWIPDTNSGNFAFDATTRINGREVLPTQVLSPNQTRIISMTDFPRKDYISGIGGKDRSPGLSSVQGKIAAIITFEDTLTEAQLLPLELELQRMYINYSGPVLSSTPSFKQLVGSAFSFDFATVAVDEWFDLANYELLFPLDVGLSFTGSVLSGTLSRIYEGDLDVRILNDAGLSSDFKIPLRSVLRDPIIAQLPAEGTLTGIFSTYPDAGLYMTRWEDARRLNDITLSSTAAITTQVIDGNPAVITSSLTSIKSSSSLSGRSFVWVYRRQQTGSKKLLDSFPDIFGQGALWTIGIAGTDVFGNTLITRSVATVNKTVVDALSFRLDLNRPYIIWATNADPITYTGFEDARGAIQFFASWSTVISEADRRAFTSVLATRYISSTFPVLNNTATRFNYTSNAVVPIEDLAIDLHSPANLTYSIVSGSGTITNNAVTYSVSTDQLRAYVIRATNATGQFIDIPLTIDNILKTNPLYLLLRTQLSLQGLEIDQIYLNTLDTLTSTTWTDYTGNGLTATGTNTLLSSVRNIASLASTPTAPNILTFNTPMQLRCLVIVWVPTVSGSSLLAATSTAARSNSGMAISPSYVFKLDTLNITVVDYPSVTAVSQLAPIQGHIVAILGVKNGSALFAAVHFRDTYDPTGSKLNCTFNNTLLDTAKNAAITGTAAYNPATSSLNAGASYLTIPNNTNFSVMSYDFTLSFNLRIAQNTGRLSIFKLEGFEVYLFDLVLYAESAEMGLSITSTFNAIRITRRGQVLTLWLNDVAVSSVPFTAELYDTLTPATVGSFPLPASSTVLLNSLLFNT